MRSLFRHADALNWLPFQVRHAGFPTKWLGRRAFPKLSCPEVMMASTPIPNPPLAQPPVAEPAGVAVAVAWRQMVGIALLWFALAALLHVAQADRSMQTALVAVSGFLAFAAGLTLFATALRRAIVADLAGGRGR
jgi:hypothetical protein